MPGSTLSNHSKSCKAVLKKVVCNTLCNTAIQRTSKTREKTRKTKKKRVPNLLITGSNPAWRDIKNGLICTQFTQIVDAISPFYCHFHKTHQRAIANLR